MQIRRYRAEDASAWNAFNNQAVNGHFLFDRDFMDYHADRFEDASLIVEDEDVLVALLPLNSTEDEAWSHQGLTFGGLVHGGLRTQAVMAALDACAAQLRASGSAVLNYKAMPSIYPSRPAQADLYWLFRRDASLARRDVSAAIDYRARGHVSSRRARGARKAGNAGLVFRRSNDWPAFWRLLEGVLAERHGAAPVHSLAEIERLASLFHDQIALHVAANAQGLQAGVVMFASTQVAHAQYIAVGEAGRETGALDGLFDHLIALYATTHRYFDFGISNTDQGRVLNEGLMRQKEEFGASAVVHDLYRVAL
ncbi:MAG TPA: GNAT family N-acetyltransferase [Caulobacteraceae bacterium]